MIEQTLEKTLITLIKAEVTASVKVIDIVPNPETIGEAPFVIVNIADGSCQKEAMGDGLSYRVDGNVNIDIITLDKDSRYSVMQNVMTAISKIQQPYRITLTSFKNSVDTTGHKPIYVKENVFSMMYKENYNA